VGHPGIGRCNKAELDAACASQGDCASCTQTTECAWCLAAAKCVTNTLGECAGQQDHVGAPGTGECPSAFGQTKPRRDDGFFDDNVCEQTKTCKQCKANRACAWCVTAGRCFKGIEGPCESTKDHVGLMPAHSVRYIFDPGRGDGGECPVHTEL